MVLVIPFPVLLVATLALATSLVYTMRPVHLLLLAGLTARAVDAQDYQCFTSYQELYDAVVDFLNNIPAVGQTYGPVMADWCTGAVDKFSFMFFGLDFDGPLNWDTSNGVQFTSMFERSPYNQPLDWLNLSSAEDVSNMFKDTTAFNQPLAINTSNVQTFTGMVRAFPLLASAFVSHALSLRAVKHLTRTLRWILRRPRHWIQCSRTPRCLMEILALPHCPV